MATGWIFVHGSSGISTARRRGEMSAMPTYEIDDRTLRTNIERDLRAKLLGEIQTEIAIEPFLDSNVIVEFRMGRYLCTFCLMIGLMADQYEPTIDYTVKWIKNHYNTKSSSPKLYSLPLKRGERFLFIFAPPVASLSEQTVEEMAGRLVPNTDYADLRWMAHAVPEGSEADQRAAMQSVLHGWLATQPSGQAILFDRKVVTIPDLPTPDGKQDYHLTCLIAYLG
jgi:hypothetical protein